MTKGFFTQVYYHGTSLTGWKAILADDQLWSPTDRSDGKRMTMLTPNYNYALGYGHGGVVLTVQLGHVHGKMFPNCFVCYDPIPLDWITKITFLRPPPKLLDKGLLTTPPPTAE